ncbi:hypothetical protein [Thermococcus nautili]|uniref:Uncharacterized protein n=1 Tax=Thermococcus nautili TaxID=195522 RepID=W8NWC3_9EURY|nr:hypothetical protein [Thermococcus nautili]AHL23507.1 hypothetical protein BD01_1905 [Thermococcus nautili]CAI1492757.1 conserved exported protein of unknown function [Thermococcus nautili]
MRRNAKKRLLPLVFALVLTVVGAALAVPQISVRLQPLGQGQESYPSQYDITAAVNFQLSNDGSTIQGVKVYLIDNDPNVNVQVGDTVYIQLIGTDGNTVLWSGSGQVQEDNNNNLYVEITGLSVSVNQLGSVKVTYQGQEITS